MGKFAAGKWILGILLYYFIFFLVLNGVQNTQAYYSTANDMDFNDPNFVNKFDTFMDNIGECTGKSPTKIFLGRVSCKKLNLDISDKNGCNNISNCVWKNYTQIPFTNITVIPQSCQGLVNESKYGIELAGAKEICTAMMNESFCDLFGCTWLNQSQFDESTFDVTKGSKQLISIWETIKWIITFRANIGIGTYSFIITYLLVFIPLVIIIIAFYFSTPIIH